MTRDAFPSFQDPDSQSLLLPVNFCKEDAEHSAPKAENSTQTASTPNPKVPLFKVEDVEQTNDGGKFKSGSLLIEDKLA